MIEISVMLHYTIELQLLGDTKNFSRILQRHAFWIFVLNLVTFSISVKFPEILLTYVIGYQILVHPKRWGCIRNLTTNFKHFPRFSLKGVQKNLSHILPVMTPKWQQTLTAWNSSLVSYPMIIALLESSTKFIWSISFESSETNV